MTPRLSEADKAEIHEVLLLQEGGEFDEEEVGAEEVDEEDVEEEEIDKEEQDAGICMQAAWHCVQVQLEAEERQFELSYAFLDEKDTENAV